MMAASRSTPARSAARRTRYVDELIAAAPGFGARADRGAEFARAYIDVNREPWELDPAMFEDELPDFAQARTARVAAGLGSIARIVCRRPGDLRPQADLRRGAKGGSDRCTSPITPRWTALIAETKAALGLAVLIDWHSMPARGGRAGDNGERSCDLVLGDRFGAACAGAVTGPGRARARGDGLSRGAQRALRRRLHHRALRPPGPQGPRAADRDQPRALSRRRRRWSRPPASRRCSADLERLFAALAAQDWTGL